VYLPERNCREIIVPELPPDVVFPGRMSNKTESLPSHRLVAVNVSCSVPSTLHRHRANWYLLLTIVVYNIDFRPTVVVKLTKTNTISYFLCVIRKAIK